MWLKPVGILPFCLVGISTRVNYFNVYLSIPTAALCYMRMNIIFPQMKQACNLERYMKRNFVLCTYRQHSIKLTYILDSFHLPFVVEIQQFERRVVLPPSGTTLRYKQYPSGGTRRLRPCNSSSREGFIFLFIARLWKQIQFSNSYVEATTIQ